MRRAASAETTPVASGALVPDAGYWIPALAQAITVAALRTWTVLGMLKAWRYRWT